MFQELTERAVKRLLGKKKIDIHQAYAVADFLVALKPEDLNDMPAVESGTKQQET